MSLTPDLIAALPKVVLHDHLDGGLRPATVIELAEAVGHELPSTDPAELGEWFVQAADSGSLERFLETFAHTVAVLQTTEGLRRAAREAVVDLAADGVVYAEQRYAPEQHLEKGLSLQEVVDAVQQGLDEGVALAEEAGSFIRVGTILTAMRNADRGEEIARLSLTNRDVGVVGFDIAGPEAGFPPTRHRGAFDLLRRESFPFTIHAGEGAGAESIWEALQLCGAVRIGHGLRILEDVRLEGYDSDGFPLARVGRLSSWVRERQVPLELCPSSNVQTGAAASIADHPITLLRDLGFTVTVNTDNRLMSGTSMTREMTLLVAEAEWTLGDLEGATLAAAFNAFAPYDLMRQVVMDEVLPGFAEAGAAIGEADDA
jgi:adenosine deaminase